eukprot:PhF_6_TR10559/c0_g1_i2/m.16795
MDYLRSLKFMKRKEESERVKQLLREAQVKQTALMGSSGDSPMSASKPTIQSPIQNNTRSEFESSPHTEPNQISENKPPCVIVRVERSSNELMHTLGRKKFGVIATPTVPKPPENIPPPPEYKEGERKKKRNRD